MRYIDSIYRIIYICEYILYIAHIYRILCKLKNAIGFSKYTYVLTSNSLVFSHFYYCFFI